MRFDQDFLEGHGVVGPSASSGWQLGCAVTSGWPWDSHGVGMTCHLWGWPSLGCEGSLPMGHACWHVQGCRLTVVAKMGLLETLHSAIVGLVEVTSASEIVGGSLLEMLG